MRISNSRLDKILQSYLQQTETVKDKQANSVKKESEAKSKRDSAAITAKSPEFQKAKELYSRLPDVREEKIREARERLLSGNYVSSEEIAEKIIYRSLADREV